MPLDSAVSDKLGTLTEEVKMDWSHLFFCEGDALWSKGPCLELFKTRGDCSSSMFVTKFHFVCLGPSSPFCSPTSSSLTSHCCSCATHIHMFLY